MIKNIYLILPLSIAGAGITIIEIYALHCGINGIALKSSFIALGAIAGFIFKTITHKKAKEKHD